ncbi:bifunctional nuclease family protein [Ferrimicrobium sp.]|uniref:bifunctional nuclease family protein n=2 Tax=Ferrimicrobium sp. TaxID=2926050 RepID=UPI002604C503|nr:bifunctional nuclease domain-containing protein [Ferrimicrobium sp.]
MPVLEPESFNLAGFVPCRMVRVGIDLPEPFARITLLPDDTSLVEFEIPISIEQARQLALIVAKERAPRPMTTELMQDILASYGFSVSYVALQAIVDGNVHAVLALSSQDGRTRLFSARPSDAIMLALLQPVQAPILVSPTLVAEREEVHGQEDSGVTVQENEPEDGTEPSRVTPVSPVDLVTSKDSQDQDQE